MSPFYDVYKLESLIPSLVSPDEILSQSHGEVILPETINHISQKPERDGLFAERIFGPMKDFECACGQFEGNRHWGIICDRCGVEVNFSRIRSERIGHIKLAYPILDFRFRRQINNESILSLLLEIPSSDINEIVSFKKFFVTKTFEDYRGDIVKQIAEEYKSKGQNQEDPDSLKEAKEQAIKEIQSIRPFLTMTEPEYDTFSQRYSALFDADTGPEPLRKILEKLDISLLQIKLEKEIKLAQKSTKEILNRRLEIVKVFKKIGARPEWMFLTIIPVIPPRFRPAIRLDNGQYSLTERYMTQLDKILGLKQSLQGEIIPIKKDLNDLYRRVITKNNRIKFSEELNQPLMLREEILRLQSSVNNLVGNYPGIFRFVG